MKHSINIILLLLVLCGCSSSNGKKVEQYAPNKEITGKYDIMIFKGIPYAVQPTDRMRWRAPQAPLFNLIVQGIEIQFLVQIPKSLQIFLRLRQETDIKVGGGSLPLLQPTIAMAPIALIL